MAKQSNQKAKLLYLQKFLTEETDAQHGITIAGLVDRLAEAGIAAERKSLYDDIEVLRAFGLQIETVRGRANSYKLTGRVLQAQEVVKTGLALKAAGVEGAEAIIDSLCGLLSKYDAESVKTNLLPPLCRSRITPPAQKRRKYRQKCCPKPYPKQ